jgi:hypothetical protein
MVDNPDTPDMPAAAPPAAPAASDKTGLASKIGGFFRFPAGARQVFAMLALLAIVALVVATLFLGVERSRSNYFEQRNLRELDRLAANIDSTGRTLGSVSSLYFNPGRLHYSLTPTTECLMASTRIQRTADMSIDIKYYFVDSGTAAPAPTGGPKESGQGQGTENAAGQGQSVENAAAQPPKQPPAAPEAKSGCRTDGPLPDRTAGETMTIDRGRIGMSKWLPLRDLLRPMTAGAAPDPAARARQVLAGEAARRLERGGFGPAPGGVPEVVTRSLDAAFARNAIRTEVSVGTAALDLDTSLETFDALLILRDEGTTAVPLFQAGQVPPAIAEDEKGAGRDFLQTILSASGQASGSADAASKNVRNLQEGSGSLLMESRVYRTNDLTIFEKRYAGLGSFACSVDKPCRIVGIVTNKRFGNTVRKFEGMQATAFLVAVLTLAGLLPMIHLWLRKRLDAIGRRIQYVMWFSLTLLAASAMIASLTIWAGGISRTASSAYARDEIKRVQGAFATELDRSLRLIVQLGARLKPSQAVFPAPSSIGWSKGIPARAQDAAILDTTGFIRGDGYVARDMERFSDLRMPPFGTNIADRPYFLRALSDDYSIVKLRGRKPCYGKAAGLEFLIDRVLARPDGVAKTIFLLPPQPGCFAAPAGDAEDPSRARLLLASGYLQTFAAADVHPGFHYVVIDPSRPKGEPDILFSDRPSAELAEEFSRDLDDKEAFRIIADELRPHATDEGAAPRIRRLATHYRSDPVRLTITRLHPDVGWILVVIEGRNDSGFSIWRAATFGYSTWLAAILLIVGINGFARLWKKEALDRRPGLWLWPADVITDFTPARFAIEEDRRRQLGEAAAWRDWHMLRVLIAGAVGIMAAEGASRTALALCAVMTAFAARSHFRGLTASDREAARKLDFVFTMLAAVLLLISLALFAGAIRSGPAAGDMIASQGVRVAVFLVSLLFLVRPIIESLGSAAREGSLSARFAALFTPLFRRIDIVWREDETEPRKRDKGRPVSAKQGARPWRAGWMLFLLTIGALPAAAGFLDSIDHDSTLVAERSADVAIAGQDARSRALASIDTGRSKKLPAGERKRIARGILPGGAAPLWGTGEAGKAAGRRPWDLTIADLSVRSLDLHETALSFSDFRAFHMRDGFGAIRNGPYVKALIGLFAMLLPFLILYGALFLFRRQYFTKPPRSPPINPSDFSPPLTCARGAFLTGLLVPAATGGKPPLPFSKNPSQRHLILGVDFDIRAEPTLAALDEEIAWINLLDIADGDEPPAAFAAKVKAVVIGNLDIALQLPERAQVKRVFEAMEKIVAAANLPSIRRRHVFVLADVAPLDRIALLRGRDDGGAAGTIEDWRWASLLQDFTLIAVVPTSPLPGATRAKPSCAERELRTINTTFARALLAQLDTPAARKRSDGGYENRVIDYVAEQMADYYHKLWAASSDEERVILYHIGWRSHLKMTEGPAVRSLLVRGLIVRSPEYRLMNKSFARYVRRIERLDRIRKRAADAGGMDQIWPLIRLPLIVFTGALLVIVQLVSPGHATGALGIVPALGAVVPALLGSWLRQRTAG